MLQCVCGGLWGVCLCVGVLCRRVHGVGPGVGEVAVGGLCACLCPVHVHEVCIGSACACTATHRELERGNVCMYIR